jgi:glycosyltransferase involved in cell wall biosynthesis
LSSSKIPSAQYTKGLILYIGTIIRKKGVLELPAIFEKVLADFPEAQLVLIGGDSFDLSTQSTSTWRLLQHQLSKKCPIKSVLFRESAYREIQDYIKRANVCVFLLLPKLWEWSPLSLWRCKKRS